MNEIDKIIIRFLERTASEEDLLYLDNWIKEEESSRYFRQFVELWEKSAEDYSLFDNQRAYERLSAELNLKAGKLEKVGTQTHYISKDVDKSTKGRKLFINVMKYAAAVLFPVALFIVLFYSKDEIATTVAEAVIEPGSSKAVLIMADGAKLNLSDDSLQISDEQTGVSISNDKRQIRYKSGANQIQGDNKEHLKYNTIVVGRGGEYQLVLSDGTKVWLNSESKLKYPVVFGSDVRNVELEGEAYFSVTKDKKKPFKVKTAYGLVKVLGTSFNIMAYKSEDVFETTLVEGSVALKMQSGNEVKLKPGQQGRVIKGENKINVREVDIDYYCSWKDNELLFENVSLEELLIKLGRWYDFEVFYQNSDLKKLRFSGGIDKFSDIKEAIELIELTNKVKISINKKVLIVRDK